MKKRLMIVLILLFTLLSHGTELKRNGWNLIAVCQDMNASDIDMSYISEIQNQNGKSIYTGEFKDFSNLERLEAGYAYWVKGEAGDSFFSGEALSRLEKPLLREEWNLMASCDDIKRADLNMSSLVEIQNQDGKSIYTGEFESFSNLKLLENGYGYWVKGELGTLFSSKSGLSIPSSFIYQTINNRGEIVESIYRDYIIKLFSDNNHTANSQSNHVAIVVRLNGENTPVMQIENSYRGENIVIGVYNSMGELVAVSELINIPQEGSGIFIEIQLDDNNNSNNDNNSSDNNQTDITKTSKYHDVLALSLKFYEAQRAIGPFPTVKWRKPASTNDGADVGVDLNGGWFDAGDHVKFNLPMSYSVGMLNWSMIDNAKAYEEVGKALYGKEQVKYALDYLLNTYDVGDNLSSPDDDKVYFQVADGYADHDFWGPPEDLNMKRPTFTCDSDGGCAAVAGSMVGAFASGAILFKDDSAYSAKLLESAKRLYAFGMKFQTDLDYSSVGQNFYALYENTHNEDQLAWGAIWLYKATNDSRYLNDAKAIMQGIYPWTGHTWDNLALGVFSLLSELTNDSNYRSLVEKELDNWVNKRVPTSRGGLRVLQRWGSLRLASTASFIALHYSETLSSGSKKDAYVAFAKSQIDYILGENPNNFSYVVGYGDNYPTHVHHRAASGTTESDPADNKYVIEGALVGGPLSADDNDYQDIRNGEIGYTANEVATDYNAGFTGALAKLALLYGKDVNASDNNNSGGDDNSTTQNPTDTELVATAKKALTFDTIKNRNLSESEIKSNLSLITLGEKGVSIRWASSSSAISPQGIVTRNSNNQQVTLTATLSKGAVSDTKSFTLVVLKEESNAGACQVTYGVRDAWDSGFVVDFSVVNQQGNLYGWDVTFTLPTGQHITDIWNGDKSASEGFIKVTNKDYNAQVDNGAKAEFGFVVNHSGQEGIPTDIRFNGKLCDGQIGGVEKPKKPTELKADLINNSKVNLSWVDSSDNEDNFLVYQSIDLGAWKLLALLDANQTSYENIEVELEHSYDFKVEAKNIAGSATSSTINVTPLIIPIQSGIDNKAVALVSNCMTCHQESKSNPSIPIIHGLGRDYLEKTLKGYRTSDTNSNHYSFAMHRIMDGYSDNDIKLMANYFSTQSWIGNRVVSYDVETIKDGKTIFENNCIACHGTDGKTNKIMLSGQSEQYLVDTMTNYAKGLHKDAHDGMKSVFKNTIGDEPSKIEALAKYLAVGLKVPIGDNNTIRGFKAKYLSSSNSVALSWDYINPKALRIEVLVNGVLVKTLNDISLKETELLNDGNASFVINNNYAISLKVITQNDETLSPVIDLLIKTDEAYGQEHYNRNCKVCHGVNGTARADITKWNITQQSFSSFTQNSDMDESYYSNCDSECLELIGIYVQNVLIPRARDNNDSNITVDVNSDIVRGYRLLNRVEYTNTLHTLFEISKDASRAETLALNYTELPKDNIVEGYNTDRNLNMIDEDKIKAFNKMASRVEEYLNGLKGQNSKACLINGYDFCVANKDEFLNTFATKIFRRPLSLAEKNRYASLDSVGKIVGDMLVSPKFLYRSEMGTATKEAGVYLLNQYEIATAISYAMAGTTPDDKLLDLAKQGALSNPNTRVIQAVRLGKLQTGKDKLDDFIGRWLLEDNIYSLSDKNPERFNGYNDEVRTAQSTQILKQFRMVMQSSSHSTYKDLFINDYVMSNRVLSDYYGENMSTSETFEQVPATSRRYGLLTLGAIASKYANSEESHPFKRGKFVLARLMCHPLGVPGNGGDVPAIVDHRGENKRDRYSQHVNDPSCATCHHLIDPIGFTWENYDGSGRYRVSEYHSQADGGPKVIDASVTLRGVLTFDESETYPAKGMHDVSELIANSDRGPECMALQYYRYISGDSHAEIENSLVVKKIVSDFKNEQYDLQSLFTNMVKFNSFITRKGE